MKRPELELAPDALTVAILVIAAALTSIAVGWFSGVDDVDARCIEIYITAPAGDAGLE